MNLALQHQEAKTAEDFVSGIEKGESGASKI